MGCAEVPDGREARRSEMIAQAKHDCSQIRELSFEITRLLPTLANLPAPKFEAEVQKRMNSARMELVGAAIDGLYRVSGTTEPKQIDADLYRFHADRMERACVSAVVRKAYEEFGG